MINTDWRNAGKEIRSIVLDTQDNSGRPGRMGLNTRFTQKSIYFIFCLMKFPFMYRFAPPCPAPHFFALALPRPVPIIYWYWRKALLPKVVGFPNWHVSGCQLGEETPVHSPIWLWRLLEPSNLVAPPKKYTFRIGTFIESIFALDSSFRSAVVAEV